MNKNKLINTKIYTPETVLCKINEWHKTFKKIVFTNGCFDLLHLGHADYLSKAADLGDFLIVGLNTDVSVKINKGSQRPITDEKSRAFLLASLFYVDAVVLFNEKTPLTLIETIKPHILVKGKDYREEDIVGYDFIKKNGGNILTIDLIEGYSTSLIEKRIIDLNKND